MDDKKIRELFADYEAPLTSGEKFIENLERNLNCIESVKRQNTILKSIYKKALCVALVAGFTLGLFFSLLLPYFQRFLEISNRFLTKDTVLFNSISGNNTLIAWILIGSITTFASVSAYELSLSIFRDHSSKAN